MAGVGFWFLALMAAAAVFTCAQSEEATDHPEPIILFRDVEGTTDHPDPVILYKDQIVNILTGNNSFEVNRDEFPEPFVSLHEFEVTNPDSVPEGELFEKDILLTPRQWQEMKLRKAITDPRYRWPNTVLYRYADGNVNQAVCREAMDHWEEHTCLKFEETSDLSKPHLQFKKLSGCYSYLGRLWWQNGQDVSIGTNCDTLGIVAHEIGHAMGFFHEQSRPDRDSYVQVNEDNVVDGKQSQFEKQTTSIDTYSVPYDYTSVMHYGSKFFTKNGKFTIATLDPMAQELIGSRAGLSHYDKLLANRIYSCLDTWLTQCGLSSDPCQNFGYTGKECSCVCPSGTSGTNCEITTAGYYEEKLSSCSEEVNTEGAITSPNYPNNYNSNTRCTKKIVAPECYSPRVTFSSFRLYGRSTCSDGASCCYFDGLRVSFTSLGTGQWFCGQELAPGRFFQAAGQELFLYFETRTNYYSGWSADVSFIPKSGCTPTATTTSTPTTATTTSPTTTTTPTPTTTITTTPTPTTTTTTTTPTPTTTTTTTTPTTTTTTTTTPTTTTTTTTTTSTTTTTTTPPATTTSVATTTVPQLVCQLRAGQKGYQWTSPNFGAQNYPNDFTCTVRGYAITPASARFILNAFQLQSKTRTGCKDFVKFDLPYSRKKKMCGSRSGVLKVPNYKFELEFRTNSAVTAPGFNITIADKQTSCHMKIVRENLGDTGVIQSPRYPNPHGSNAACEWWIVAPNGYKIRLDFIAHSTRWSRNCWRNYLVVDQRGTRSYGRENSEIFCGKTTPAPLTSVANEVDLVYMGKRRSRGFKIRYTVV
ncbi:protein SpAN-like [Penaeus japonicus]|uniref:protein SpAN-like n=1 Tax=Penaeus japonicus TaxID=27405 RepID=UPI001C7151D6|nr:protein SpAN-like [Penaeus japonicus]